MHKQHTNLHIFITIDIQSNICIFTVYIYDEYIYRSNMDYIGMNHMHLYQSSVSIHCCHNFIYFLYGSKPFTVSAMVQNMLYIGYY